MRTAATLTLAAVGLYFLARSRLGEEALYYLEDVADEAASPDEPNLQEIAPMDEAANVSAFLALIRRAEGGTDAYDYDDLVGGGNFTDFSDHPAITGEFAGIRTRGGLLSTAAGAYQITRSTWRDLGGKARFGDFSPAAQDAAALAILQEKRPGAYRMIAQGRFLDAIYRLRNEWEAFDRMINDNYKHFPLEQAQAYYVNSGGTVA
jgi:lysozyme